MSYTINSFFSIALTFLIWLLFLFFSYMKEKNKKILVKKAILRLFLFLYIGFIVSLTLLPVSLSSFGTTEHVYVNLNIFSIFEYELTKFALINILGNLFLFTPLVLLTALNGYKIFDKFYKVIFYGIIFSLCIESIQYVQVYFGLLRVPRIIDILDVLLNASGAIIGFLCVKVIPKNKFIN